MLLSTRKIKWIRPRKVQLLIVNRQTSLFFLEIINNYKLSLEILAIEKYIYINFAILFKSLLNLILLKDLKSSYLDFLFKQYSPEYILSFSDFDVYKTQTFLSQNSAVVQIGLRGNIARGLGRKSIFNKYYCLGENSKKFFQENKSKIKNYEIIGSVKNNHYFHEIKPLKNIRKKYDFLLILPYREPEDKINTSDPAYINSVEIIKFFVKYCEKTNTKCAILFKERNIKHFNKILKEIDPKSLLINLFPSSDYSSYINTDEANIIFSCGSTLGLEAFSRGNKIIFFNFTSNPDFSFPLNSEETVDSKKLFVKKQSDIKNKIEDLNSISDEDWISLVKKVGYPEVHFDKFKNTNKVLINNIINSLKESC